MIAIKLAIGRGYQMRGSYVLLMALTLAGCGSFDLQQLQQETDALYAHQANVGKDYWLTGVVTFCQGSSLSIIIKDCILLSGAPVAGTHLKIDGIEKRGLVNKGYYDVTLDDGRTGYISTYDLIDHGTDIDPIKAAAACKRSSDPHVGMTAKQVEANCWGKPDDVNRTQTAEAISG
jgi:hypothetical protein